MWEQQVKSVTTTDQPMECKNAMAIDRTTDRRIRIQSTNEWKWAQRETERQKKIYTYMCESTVVRVVKLQIRWIPGEQRDIVNVTHWIIDTHIESKAKTIKYSNSTRTTTTKSAGPNK